MWFFYEVLLISENLLKYIYEKGCFLTSKSFRLTILTPHSCPRLTSSASNASISTMVFTVFPFPLTQSRMIRAFSATSQITVEMEPEKKKKKKINKNMAWVEPLCITGSARNFWTLWQYCRWRGKFTGAPFVYLCRLCSQWPQCQECHTMEPPPGSMCNRPPLKWSTGRQEINRCER